MPITNYQEFARILDGDIMRANENLCVVSKMRDVDVTVPGRYPASPLTLAAMFCYENPDAQGRTLNLGEMVILPTEVNDFISVLRSKGISITALHNHWLFEKPRFMYLHWQAVDHPLAFARHVAEAFSTLSSRITDEDLEFI